MECFPFREIFAFEGQAADLDQWQEHILLEVLALERYCKDFNMKNATFYCYFSKINQPEILNVIEMSAAAHIAMS